MPSNSTQKLLNEATGTDKFLVLAVAIDHLNSEVREQSRETNIEDQVETFDIADLAQQYEISAETMRKRICKALGTNAVIKVGKRRVIRKARFLDYLIACEEEAS